MSEKKVVLNVQEGVSEIHFLEGEAPKHHDPHALSIIGDINAPKEFFTKRNGLEGQAGNFSPSSTYVHVDMNKGIILLIQHDRNKFCNSIKGCLEVSQKFKDFQINTDKKFFPKELARHLSRRRHLFHDQQEALRLIAELNSFNASIKTNVSDKDDRRGNTDNRIEKSVKTNMPLSFTLNIPLFSGMDNTPFQVEILVESDGGTVSFTLDSVEAIEKMEGQREQIIESALEPFFAAQIPVIYT